jgi:hypothetical protein
MAIIDTVKNQVIAAGSQYALKKVSGILRGSPGNTEKTPTNQKSNNISSSEGKPTNILSYPLDVTGGPGVGNQGHYVMFFINEQEDAQVRFGTRGNKNAFDDVLKSKEENNIPDYIREIRNGSYEKMIYQSGVGNQLNDNIIDLSTVTIDKKKINVEDNRSSGNTLYVQRAPTVRLDTAIALYMPPQANYIDRANYTDTEIGVAAKAGIDVYSDIVSRQGAGATVRGALDTLGEGISEGLTKLLLGTVGAIPGFGGVREAAEMGTGVVIADRLELAFKGIAKRKFQFQFKMLPKNQREADEIRKIIFAFRANMLPEFEGGNRAGRKLRVPSTFDISYMYNGSENQYLQKISTCVLENCTVSYGGDRYRTFTPNDEGAPPVETNITLEFGELELITKERVYEGY